MAEFSKRDVERILRKNNFTLHRCKGSHKIYKNKEGKHLSVVPTRCNRMIMQRLIKEYNLEIN